MSSAASHNGSAHKLVIIGSGPAGWTAAIYAARAQLDPVCYIGIPKNDPGPVLPGGQLMLTTEVENYPGFSHGITGPKMMEEFQKQAERFGTVTHMQDVVKCEFSPEPARIPHTLHIADGTVVRAHAVIIATGAVANWLGLDNEMRLARSGGGVSACAVCDGALPAFRNQPLAVIGGGDTAMEEASYLTKFGSVVYVIHRRDSLRASKIMQERFMSRPNAKVLWNKVVVDVLGGEFIEGVLLEDTVTKERSTLALKGLFIAIGHTPATKFLKGTGLEFDDAGYVALKQRNSYTNLPGVFAAGDVADGQYRQAVSAAGMGCIAALDAERWLAASNVH
ncbi:MAG: thioredoxin-disulfide reductase [Phycisphaerales bacterium]|jgi:thioredoxin reductase (NADPH)|nr:thioredoxin-disulfide reductase [Phycisphaerales bacterium]